MRFRILPNKDRIFRLLILNQVLLWCSVFRGEGSGNEDNFLNAGCCAGPRFQAGKVPPLSPASPSFSSHQVLHSTGKQCIFDSSGNLPLGASGIACGEGDRAVSSSARDIDGTSGARADVHGALPEGADSVSRALPVVSCAGDFALYTVVSTAAASPGSRLLRVLGGGHSADRGACSGAGIVACHSGLEHVTRQACSSICGLVGVSGSLSSHHVDRVRSRSVFGDGDTNSCWDTHVARANSWSTLHPA